MVRGIEGKVKVLRKETEHTTHYFIEMYDKKVKAIQIIYRSEHLKDISLNFEKSQERIEVMFCKDYLMPNPAKLVIIKRNEEINISDYKYYFSVRERLKKIPPEKMKVILESILPEARNLLEKVL